MYTRFTRLSPYTTSTAVKFAERRSAILALDFDETLTTQCTLADVVAVARQKHRNGSCKDFQWCTNEYMKDLCAYEVQFQSVVGDQGTPTAWSHGMLNEYLEGLRPIEKASLERLGSRQVLAGASRKEFYAGGGGRGAKIRSGAAALINKVLSDSMWKVIVVSTNWSEDFIRGALEFAGVNVASTAFSVHCNSLVFASDTGLSTGHIEPKVIAARDKVDLLARYRHEQGDAPMLVYAGDSLTDLPALCLADVG
ncbi:hypothetical protein GGH95_005151, partial [Coemansia sp. RSA 1836]